MTACYPFREVEFFRHLARMTYVHSFPAPHRYVRSFAHMNHVTQIMSKIDAGDSQAIQQLLPLVYEELRKLAAARIFHEKPGQTLQATALVHEAYLRLVGPNETERGRWHSRGYFFAAAAEAMRRILVEKARSRGRLKRGGGRQRVELDGVQADAAPPALDMLALDEALNKLAVEAPEKAELVKLRFFCGLTMTEAAAVLGVSQATAERHWSFAKSWLFVELGETGENVELS